MCLRRRLETSDQLRYAAAQAGDEQYEPPFSRLADWLEGLGGGPADDGRADRAAQIQAAAAALGGDIG